ncbi:MAG: hypothetical protein JO352_06095 [Chloroflexi bacterium]|nr:hypothetical protein [Chloroflexota bacterium]
MLRSISAVFASGIVALSAAHFVASAQSAPTTDLSVEQVRAEFIADGYQVGAPLNWWTNNHVTTFIVSDASQQSGRVVVVLVYPETATAQAETSGADQLTGRRLVPGYGPALVRQNVALVESTWQELSQQYTAEQALQNEAEFGASSVMPTPPAPVTRAVDADLLSALDSAIATL